MNTNPDDLIINMEMKPSDIPTFDGLNEVSIQKAEDAADPLQGAKNLLKVFEAAAAQGPVPDQIYSAHRYRAGHANRPTPPKKWQRGRIMMHAIKQHRDDMTILAAQAGTLTRRELMGPCHHRKQRNQDHKGVPTNDVPQ